jgi:ribosomal subunit interface protein
MQLTVQGKQMDVGDALRTYVSEKLEDINSKYFNRAIDATVSFSREGHGHGMFRVQISIRVGKKIMVIADDVAGDAHAAFDMCADKVAKQLRRYKSKLRNHHDRMEQVEAGILMAHDYTLAAPSEESDDDVPQGEDPAIIAEITTEIETLSVPDAVMRMDLSDSNALLFRNAKNKGLNLVYRRKDGNIGWIDPEDNQA